MHATGLANAVDSLAAVQQLVYNDAEVTAAQMQQSIKDGFRGHETILGRIRALDFHLGGYQLQLNTVRLEQLLAAQRHPELHRDLIVRVWGWGGYFVELDRKYQDHIIPQAASGLSWMQETPC